MKKILKSEIKFLSNLKPLKCKLSDVVIFQQRFHMSNFSENYYFICHKNTATGNIIETTKYNI